MKNGQFGRVYGGYGTDDRYAAGGNISFFKGNRRLSFVGNFNNVNQQNFRSQDFLASPIVAEEGGKVEVEAAQAVVAALVAGEQIILW